jgi:hypothetical protein
MYFRNFGNLQRGSAIALVGRSQRTGVHWRFSADLRFAADAVMRSEETRGSGNVTGARRPFTARLRSAQSTLLGQSGIPGLVCPQTLALAGRRRSMPAAANENPSGEKSSALHLDLLRASRSIVVSLSGLSSNEFVSVPNVQNWRPWLRKSSKRAVDGSCTFAPVQPPFTIISENP